MRSFDILDRFPYGLRFLLAEVPGEVRLASVEHRSGLAQVRDDALSFRPIEREDFENLRRAAFTGPRVP